MQELLAKGFQVVEVGTLTALYRKRDGLTQVVTATDNLSLPTASDWLLGVYDNDWLTDPNPHLVDTIDSESSPVHLIQAVDL